jgi:hypothetical protein
MSMLSMLWWFPMAVAVAGMAAIWRAARRLETELAALRVATAELARLRPLVVDVRAEIAAVASEATRRRLLDFGPR